MIFGKIKLAAWMSAVSFVAVAAEVEISARNGVIPDAASAEVRISKSDGVGESITLAADTTHVKSLTQVQSVLPAQVVLSEGQFLVLELIRQLSGAQTLTVGKEASAGSLLPAAGTVELRVDDAAAEMKVNAAVRLDEDGQALIKTGAGRVRFGGNVCASVSQREGDLLFDNFLDGARLRVNGVSLYDYCSGMDLEPKFSGAVNPDAKVMDTETVITAEAGVIPVASFQVNGGSLVRVAGASIHQPEVSSNLDTSLDSVPLCGLVGSNSVGVLNFDGGSYTGNMVVAYGDPLKARGVLRLYNHASFVNVGTTNAVALLGAGGYANVDIYEATYTAAGNWSGAQDGQLVLSVVNGVFTHLPAAVRPSTCSLGSDNSDTLLTVGINGRFDVSAAVGDEVFLPKPGARDARQVTVLVEGGGEFDLGAHSLHMRGNANTGKTLFMVRDGGVVKAAAFNGDRQSSSNIRGFLAFDGGTFVMSGEKTYPFGSASKEQGEPTTGVYSFGKGLTLSVPEGMTAVIPDGGTVSAPTGKGVESVVMSAELLGKTFMGPPLIRFSGDAGNGAAAVCEFDRETGKVTGIRVISRGWGYTNPTAEVYYGDPTIKLLELQVTLSDNAPHAGGLIKDGAGTLVLEGTNTYAGVTEVQGGVLQLGAEDVIKSSSKLSLRNGAIFDVNGVKLEVGDYGGDGLGVVSNGVVTVTGLQIDFNRVKNEDYYETLNLTNIEFAEGAKLRLLNATESKLTDISREYLLYKVPGGVPADFPSLDTEAYQNGLPESWAVVKRGEDEIVLKYIGGSFFIYY